MAKGLPDRVDCARLAEDTAVLERVYPLGEMPRLQDLLADARGSVRASFAFAKIGSGRCGATVTVEANPHLVCQRCMQGFEFDAAASSEIEFAPNAGATCDDSQREAYSMDGGWVNLRDLAEEELLLALPIVAACAKPQSCGRAPASPAGDEQQHEADATTRPFAALQDLLKKTR